MTDHLIATYEGKKLIFYCPVESFLHIILRACDWHEVHRLDAYTEMGKHEVWVKMRAP